MLTKPEIHFLVWNGNGGVCQGNDCGRNSNFEGAGRYFFGIQSLSSEQTILIDFLFMTIFDLQGCDSIRNSVLDSYANHAARTFFWVASDVVLD